MFIILIIVLIQVKDEAKNLLKSLVKLTHNIKESDTTTDISANSDMELSITEDTSNTATENN